MDLHELLSDEAREKGVEPGDEWDIPLEFFEAVRTPSGSGEMTSSMGAPMKDVDPELDGDFKIKFLELIEVDGANFADFELSIEVTIEADLTDALAAMDDNIEVEGGGPEGFQAPEIESASNSKVFSGKGKARWDMAQNRWASMEWKVEVEEEEEMVSLINFGQGESEMVQTTLRNGTETLSYVFGE